MEKLSNAQPWKRFWFEGNQFFNWVESPADWEKVKKAYSYPGAEQSTDELLDKCRESDREGREAKGIDPKFGFARECNGKRTLREFFDEHGMTP